MALSAFTCESVLRLFSEHFRRKYYQDKACQIAWKIAKGHRVSKSMCCKLVQEIADLSDEAEQEGYSHDAIAVGAHIVAEFFEANEGLCCGAAIDYASSALAAHNLFVQGIGWPSSTTEVKYVSDKYLGKLGRPVYRLARESYERLRRVGRKKIDETLFAGLTLDRSFEPLPRLNLKKIKTKPPHHERYATTDNEPRTTNNGR